MTDKKPPRSGKYVTDDDHFAGVPKVDATPEDLFRAMFKLADRDLDERLAAEKKSTDLLRG